MNDPIPLTRAQKALSAAQRAVQEKADQIFEEVSQKLSGHPCVAFAIKCGSNFDFSPTLDVAVRLLWIARCGFDDDEGKMIRGLCQNLISPDALERGSNAVAKCAMLLKSSPLPYTFLAHTHGQNSITYCYRCNPGESPLMPLAGEIAHDVTWFSDR